MKKSKKVKAAVGLLALTMVVGTLAYFSKTMSIDNPFSTKKYGGETVEKFTPENNWEPGGQVTKEVQAKNTGDYDLWVRVKFDEKWERTVDDTKTTIFESSSVDKDNNTKNSKFFPTSADNAITDGSSVYKNLAGVTDGSWIDGQDGYFYYKETLKKDQTTSKLLDYVTLCKDANMGEYTVSEMKYALVNENTTADQLKDEDYTLSSAPDTIPKGKVLYQKKVISLDSAKAGLAGANYTLTITTELVQATAEAANGWATYPGKASN